MNDNNSETVPQQTETASNQRFFLISGIYHPKPLETDSIPPGDRWDVLDRSRLEKINKQLKGKAITVDHPFDSKGVPVLIEEYGSNYRGKVVYSRILDDGRGYFIAKLPINNNIKSRLFKKMLEDKTFSELSMTHEFIGNLDTGEGAYVPNHIALLKKDEARRPGCKILEILKMPKKRHGNIKSDENVLNLFNQLKKNKLQEKHSRLLSVASVLGKNMDQQQASGSGQPAQLQDDTQPSASAVPETAGLEEIEPAPEIIAEIVNNPNEWSRSDMAQVMVRNVHELKQKDKMLEEMAKKLAEFEKTQQETRKKQVESKRDEVASTYALIANVDYDIDAPPLTEEAKKASYNKIKEIIDKASSVDDPDPLVRKEKIIEEMGQLVRAISVASKEGAEKVSNLTKMMRENPSAYFNPSKVSSFNSRFSAKRSRGDNDDISSSPVSSSTPVHSSDMDILKALKEGKVNLYRTRTVGSLNTIYEKGEQLTQGSLNFKKSLLAKESSPFAPRTMK